MRTVRPFFEAFVYSLDDDSFGLRSIFHYLSQRIVIRRNRIRFREHRSSGFFRDDFYGVVIDDSHTHCIRVTSFRSLLIGSIRPNLMSCLTEYTVCKQKHGWLVGRLRCSGIDNPGAFERARLR